MTEDEAIRSRLLIVAQVIDDHYSPHVTGQNVGYCVDGTKCLCVLLERMGLKATPSAVRVNIFNPIYAAVVDAVQKGQPPPAGPPPGGYYITIGEQYESPAGTSPDRWQGHLVAIVESRYLVDVSIAAGVGNSSQEDRDLQLAPLVERIDESFIAGSSRLVINRPSARIVYTLTQDNDAWQAFKGWLEEPDAEALSSMHAEIQRRLAAQTAHG